MAEVMECCRDLGGRRAAQVRKETAGGSLRPGSWQCDKACSISLIRGVAASWRVRKVTGSSSQGAQEGSRSSGHHAAKPKATMPQRESEQGSTSSGSESLFRRKVAMAALSTS